MVPSEPAPALTIASADTYRKLGHETAFNYTLISNIFDHHSQQEMLQLVSNAWMADCAAAWGYFA